MALYQERWIAYAQTLAVFPYALVSVGTQNWLGRRMPVRPGVSEAPRRLALGLARLLAVLLVGGGFVLAAGLLPRFLPTEPLPSYCRTDGIAPVLTDPNGLGDRPRNLMGFLFIGPELAYRTPHAVVSTPYHRNTDGILDGIRFLRATEDASAIAIARKRRLELVLICPKDEEHDMYLGRDGAPSLFDRLRDGRPPAWLQPIALPAAAADFRLFAVTLP
ncbi:MAG: hypothetical protein FJX68_17925 [Alphaproteobacteria bacterium]|nr:hypothetical protein [Alphaproteobacteria bacterium]